MAKETTVSLTIGERLAAMKLFDAFKGNMTTLAALIDDVKLFAITPEEWVEAKLTKSPTDEEVVAIREKGDEVPNQTWKWEETNEKELTVKPATTQYLTDEIKKRSDAGEITLADVALVTLDKKLS